MLVISGWCMYRGKMKDVEGVDGWMEVCDSIPIQELVCRVPGSPWDIQPSYRFDVPSKGVPLVLLSQGGIRFFTFFIQVFRLVKNVYITNLLHHGSSIITLQSIFHLDVVRLPTRKVKVPRDLNLHNALQRMLDVGSKTAGISPNFCTNI